MHSEQIVAWEGVYGTKRRQLFRYISVGRQKSDPCPLDHPTEMPGWWRRCMKHRAPDKILLATNAAREASPSTATTPPTADGTPPAPSIPPGGFDLAAAQYAEGEAVLQARQIVSANYQKLTASYASDPVDTDGIQLWQVRWEKSVEALRKQERDDRDAAKSRGHLLHRSLVESEIAQMLEALRLLREAMPEKILAQLSIHSQGRLRRVLNLLRPALLTAIHGVRGRENDLLMNLGCLTSSSDMESAIQAERFSPTARNHKSFQLTS